MRRTSGFSLMEMMVVLLIVAIVAGASAPMISKKLSTGVGGAGGVTGLDCFWTVFSEDDESITFNALGRGIKSVVIGDRKTDLKKDSTKKPRLFITTKDESTPHIRLATKSSGANISVSDKSALWFTSADFKNAPSYSTVYGYESKATEDYSTAIGYSATANKHSVTVGNEARSKESSVAVGSKAKADETYSVAVGYDSYAYTTASIAVGYGAAANGQNSVAIGARQGSLNTSAGVQSVAIGASAISTGNDSVALGYGANTNGNNQSVAVGSSSLTGGEAIAIGTYAKATGSHSIAIGNPITYSGNNIVGAIAASERAVAIGPATQVNANSYGTVALGNDIRVAESAGSVVIGSEVNVSNVYGSVAIGSKVNTNAEYTVAIGNLATASGENAVAIGGHKTLLNTDSAQAAIAQENAVAIGTSSASGLKSVAIGYNARTLEESSIAMGSDAKASSSNSIAIGTTAKVANTATNSVAIGNGAAADHANSVVISTGGENGAASTASNQIVLGDANTTVYIPGNLVVDKTCVLSRTDGAITWIHMYDHSGNKNDSADSQNGIYPIYTEKLANNAAGEFTVRSRKESKKRPSGVPNDTNIFGLTSDRRLKNVGETFTAGLEEIKKLEVFNYVYKKDPAKTPRVGVMAQDLMKVFPDSVFKGDDGFLRIRMEDMFYALVNAVKELDKKIDLLAEKQKKIDELEKRVDTLEKRLAKLEKQMKEK